MHFAPPITIDSIRDHYDRLSPLYAALWGEHIHHGYWNGEEISPAAAQVMLVEQLARFARINRGSRVLDVGCGLGGSAIWLAEHLECTVLGVTISDVQARIASQSARRAGVNDRVRFEVVDANALNLLPSSFDAVWIVEASEHLFDKARFFRECAHCLRRGEGSGGGVIALCAWLAGSQRIDPSGDHSLLTRVCASMLCPSLGTVEDHIGWLGGAGFQQSAFQEITTNVLPTWAHAVARLQHPLARAALRTAGEETRRFAAAIPLMQQAMRTGVIGYGMFTAHKSAGAGGGK
jgi:tocopherol O-methyltransferase